MERDDAFYQEKIQLTTKQKKAWTQLVRAVNKCNEENVFFYQTLETLHGLNGNNVKDVADDLRMEFGANSDSPNCLQFKSLPSVKTVCSFADDDHFVLLKDEFWPR